MEPIADSTQFSRGIFGQYRHICAFFNSVDEQHRVLRPFIKDGFADGDKVFHYVNPERQEEHLGWLAEAGINVDRAMDTRQMGGRPWAKNPPPRGCFRLETCV